MTRRATAPSIVLLFVLAAACGSPFSAGGGADGGGDATGGPSDAGAEVISIDGPGGGEAGDASSVDATGPTDAPVHLDAPGLPDSPSVPDAPFADVVEEPPPPTCSGAFACVPGSPSGWQGPVELYRGSTAAPACTANFADAYDGTDSLDSASPATCGCTCGLSQTSCGAPTLSYFDVVACKVGTSCDSAALVPGACATTSATTCVRSPAAPVYISAAASGVTSGTCTPDASVQRPPVEWGVDGRACATTVALAQVDCKGGSVCAPLPSPPYDQNLCVMQTGDVSCPSGPYSSRSVLYGGADDTRGCSQCTCGSPGGGGCVASFSAYSSSDGTCTGQPVVYNAPFSCAGVNDPTDMRLTITPTTGSCPPSSVSPTGSVVPASPTTFCCLQ